MAIWTNHDAQERMHGLAIQLTEMMVRLPDFAGLPTDLIFAPDRECFYISTSKGYVLGLDSRSFDCKEKSRVCKKSIRRLLIFKENLLVITINGELLLWSIDGSQPVITVNCSDKLGIISAIAYHQGLDLFYLGNDSGDVFCCHLVDNSITILQKYDHHDDYISSIVISTTKKIAFVGSGDGTMSIIDLKKKRLLATTKNFEEDIMTIELLEDSNKVVLGTSMGSLKVFNWNYWGAPCDSLKPKLHNYASINCIVSIGNGSNGIKNIITASDDGIVRLCSINHLGDPTEIFRVDDDSLEKAIFIPSSLKNGDNLVCISAAEPAVYVFTLSSDTAQVTSNCAKKVSVAEDKLELKPSPGKKKSKRQTPKRSKIEDVFFKDLD